MLSWGYPYDVMEHLVGAWHFERVVDDKASMTGKASLIPHTDGYFMYREAGILTLADGQEFDAQRSYLYRALPIGFAVYFDEAPPRLFHQINLAEGPKGDLVGEAAYNCGEDLYISNYVFMPGFVFSVQHRVHGPRKHYLSQTMFRRMKAEP